MDQLDLKKIKLAFDEQIGEALTVLSLNQKIKEIISGFFISFSREAESDKHYLLAKKAQRAKEYISELHKYPELKAPLETLYLQSIVVAVTSLENFIRDLFTYTIRRNPLKLLDGDKVIHIPSSFITQYGFNLQSYVDKIIMENDKSINFQDLQSIIRTFSKYFEIQLEEVITSQVELKEKVILLQALRHIIVHKANRIDRKFIKQITGTKYIEKYKNLENNYFPIDIQHLTELVVAAGDFGELIYKLVKQKDAKSI